MWRNGNLHTLLLGMQNGNNTLHNSLVVPQMVKYRVNRIIQSISIRRPMPKRDVKYVHTKTCTWMFTAALLIVAKQWKKCKCPVTDE